MRLAQDRVLWGIKVLNYLFWGVLLPEKQLIRPLIKRMPINNPGKLFPELSELITSFWKPC
jgi:hypothetical protein